MKIIFKPAALFFLPLFLTLFSNVVISKEIIKFSFSPGKQISFVQNIKATKDKDMGKLGRQLDESSLATKITMTQTKVGWDVVSEPIKVEMKRNGKVINNPVVSLLLSAKIKYKLDSTGKLLDVEGYETLIDHFAKTLPPEVLRQLASVLSLESLKAKTITEYNGRIGDFIGAEVEIGDSFNSIMPFQLPNGSKINYDINTIISAREACGSHSCVRVNQEYDSKADSLAKISGEVINNISKIIKPELKRSSSSDNKGSIKGSISRLIDPTTMLIYEEKVNRVIDMEINIPNSGLVPVKVTENRIYQYQY